MAHKIALVGIGKIARDQHIPALAGTAEFELAATASRNAQLDKMEAFTDLSDLLAARPEIGCISLCTPPHVRYDDARRAIQAGRHVMLEKPPGATLSEVHDLIVRARTAGVTLFATWHSRYAHAVGATRDWLAAQSVRKVDIQWKEDVRRWHPGQDWIWEPGALGVFDPGINALSVLTAIYPRALHLTAAILSFPKGRAMPIAADLTFCDPDGAQVSAEFDWRHQGTQCWDIRIETETGGAILSDGGARLTIEGSEIISGPDREYSGLYARFAELLAAGESDVDLAPMRHVADAFTLAQRVDVAPFHWSANGP